MNGAISQFRISNTNRYPDTFTPEWELSADSATIAFYPLDEGGGDSIVDSARDKSLAISGAVWDSAFTCPLGNNDGVAPENDGGNTFEPTPNYLPDPPAYDSNVVLALFSDAYDEVTVDRLSTDWDVVTDSIVAIADDRVLKYESLTFAGIEMTSAPLDVSGMTHFYMDVWSPDATGLKVKLVDFGADGGYDGGNDVEHEMEVTLSGQGEWVSLNLALSDFTNLTTNESLAQIVISGLPAGSTVFLDNMLFHNSDTTGRATEPMGAAWAPSYHPGNVKALFSDAYDEISVDGFSTDSDIVADSIITVTDNTILKYADLTFATIDLSTTPLDISGMSHLHLDLWSSNATRLKVHLLDFGPDGTWIGENSSEGEVEISLDVQGLWKSIDIPLTDFVGLNTNEHIALMNITAIPFGSTVFLDNLLFYTDGTCLDGYHDGGDGTCVSNGTCVEGYSLSNSGICQLPVRLALIPAGSFSREGATVTISRSMMMMTTEVTQGLWKLVSGGANPSHFNNCDVSFPDECPVDNVSWFAATSFANALSVREGLLPCYEISDCPEDDWKDGNVACNVSFALSTAPLSCEGYRLPTEAEWEYAYRAGTTTDFYNGGAESGLSDIGWYTGNANGTTHRVAQKAPNDWGLYDMAGNVWEWVWDWYGWYPAAATDYVGPGRGFSDYRVSRGGSWSHGASYAAAGYRGGDDPSVQTRIDGFRLTRSLVPCPEGQEHNANGRCTDTNAGDTDDAGTTAAAFVINEVDYDQPGSDTAEFVELYNGTDEDIDLSGYALLLVNGSNSSVYTTIDLSAAGSLAAGQYLVVGSAAVMVPTSALSVALDGSIQNGAPDAVALVSATEVVDAFVYEGSLSADLGAPYGNTDFGDGTALTDYTDGSLSRRNDGIDTGNDQDDWIFTIISTPGAANTTAE